MKREVAATLGELERKLRELESELAAVSRAEDTQEQAQVVQEPHARLVDEAPQAQPIEPMRQPAQAPLSEPVHQTPQAPPSGSLGEYAQSGPREPLSIDLLELVRFKEKLEQTMNGLVEEYAQILSLRGPDATE